MSGKRIISKATLSFFLFVSFFTIFLNACAKKSNPPLDTDAYVNRGNAYRHKGDPNQAISDFNQVILLNPKDAEAYSDRGIVYASKGDFDRAIPDFNQAILLNPNYSNAYYFRALSYYFIRNKEKALSDLNKAIQLDPKYINIVKDNKDFKNLWNDENYKKIFQ